MLNNAVPDPEYVTLKESETNVCKESSTVTTVSVTEPVVVSISRYTSVPKPPVVSALY